MPQTINTNNVSLNAQRNLNQSQSSLATSMQRLSSGLRVNSAKDDAAGLAISERMGAQDRDVHAAHLGLHAFGDGEAGGVVLGAVDTQTRGQALHRGRQRRLRHRKVALGVQRLNVGIDRLCH